MNFLHVGSPASSNAASKAIQDASHGEWTAMHESYARTMYEKLKAYCACPRGTMERGSAKLNTLIEKIESSMYDPSISMDDATCGALDVNPERISMPDVAGIIDPRNHLVGDRLDDFINMPSRVPEPCRIAKDAPACHKVTEENWPKILRKLYKAGMITFLKKTEVLSEGRKLITGGLFCVPHKPTSDRLINDRRPANSREKRLQWCQLPSGPLLCQLILEHYQSIRASGDDLSNYFYLIKHLEEWQHRNCFGKPFKGSLLAEAGLESDTLYLPAFKVVCMGDTNGVDIAQATHEAVLREACCLLPENTLIHGKLFPSSKTLEGLYIDDHLAFQIVDKKPFRDRVELEDVHIMHRSRKRYSELGLPRSTTKAFDKKYEFRAWGTSVNSKTGIVGAPYEKLRQIEILTTALLELGSATKKSLQKLIGLYIHPFMHRRECMAVFHHIYVFLENMPDGKLCRLPHHIRDELLIACLILPLANSNIRWPVSPVVSATDASSFGGGRASTITTKGLTRTLYRFGERRGEYTKLDWVDHSIPPPSSMDPVPEALAHTMMKHNWVTTDKIRFRRKEHINLLEMEMVKRELQHRVNEGRGKCRACNLCDSRVVVGAYAKGRSSSRVLNHKLRTCLAWSLTGDVALTNIWVATDCNPADYPSRNKPIPPPKKDDQDPLLSEDQLRQVQVHRTPGTLELFERESMRSGEDPLLLKNFQSDGCESSQGTDVQTLAVKAAEPAPTAENPKHAWTFREVFAGKARMSTAMRKVHGIVVETPIDFKKGKRYNQKHNILNDACFDFLLEEARKPRQWWHFGLPCCSFSILQHSNGGTRRRHCPAGLGTLQREIEGNEILRRTMQLIRVLEDNNNHWSLENPHSSYVWWMPDMRNHLQSKHMHSVSFDQCAYGLRLMGEQNRYGPCKKHTRFVGNFKQIVELERKCSCKQTHVHAVGGVRTRHGWKRRSELAGHYPAALAKQYSLIVSQVVSGI